MTTRIMDGSDDFFRMLTSLAYDEGRTEGEMTVCVFFVYEFLKKDMRKNCGKLALIDENNNVKKIYIMPWEEVK